MIYTVTFNPSLDYIVSVKDFQMGMTNRTSEELMLPGGKGINVSIVLHALGFQNVALGFTAGFVGEEIKRRIGEFGVEPDFIDIPEGTSRINLKLKSSDGTEINGMGPEIPKEKVEELMAKLEALNQGDVLVLAGSIPASMSNEIYKEIIERMDKKEVVVVVDATSELLLKVLPYRPFLIKPNHHELSEIFGKPLSDKREIACYAKILQDMGAKNVLVSMGARGAVLAAENGTVYEAEAPKGRLVNSVGSGDSMVAGFLAGYLGKQDTDVEKKFPSGSPKEAFRLGLAAGSASAFSENLATKEEIEEVLKQVVIHRLEL